MKPLREDKAIVLTAEEAAFVRQALCAASGILGLAAAGGPARKALEEAALETVCGGRPLAQVRHDVNLAAGCTDFAAPAGRNR